MWQYYCFPALLIRVQISDVWSDKWLFTNWIVQLRIFVFLTSALPITLIRFPVLELITPIFKTDLSGSTSSQDICVSLVKTGDHYCFVSKVFNFPLTVWRLLGSWLDVKKCRLLSPSSKLFTFFLSLHPSLRVGCRSAWKHSRKARFRRFTTW